MFIPPPLSENDIFPPSRDMFFYTPIVPFFYLFCIYTVNPFISHFSIYSSSFTFSPFFSSLFHIFSPKCYFFLPQGGDCLPIYISMNPCSSLALISIYKLGVILKSLWHFSQWYVHISKAHFSIRYTSAALYTLTHNVHTQAHSQFLLNALGINMCKKISI